MNIKIKVTQIVNQSNNDINDNFNDSMKICKKKKKKNLVLLVK